MKKKNVTECTLSRLCMKESMPFPLNKSTGDEENKHLELPMYDRERERIFTPLSSNKNIENEKNNITTIHNLYIKINFLKAEKTRL